MSVVAAAAGPREADLPPPGDAQHAPSGEEDYTVWLARARGAWVSAGGLEAEATQRQAPPKPPAPPLKKKLPRKPLDIPTALHWYDEILRYRAENPRAATRAEIQHAWGLHVGRYAPTKYPLPIDDMDVLQLSIGQWRDVFARADKWLLQKAAPTNTAPPYQLFLRIAEDHAHYRKKICDKEGHLNQLRRAHRPAPSE